MINPWDNPVAAPSYATPLIDFGVLNQQQQRQQPQQQPRYNLLNPNPNGLAARLAQFLKPPEMNYGSPGGTGGGLDPNNNGGIY